MYKEIAKKFSANIFLEKSGQMNVDFNLLYNSMMKHTEELLAKKINENLDDIINKNQDKVYTTEEIENGLKNFQYTGLFGPDGQLIKNNELSKSKIVTDIKIVNKSNSLESRICIWYYP